MPLWLLVLVGGWEVPTAFTPLTWHAHEMIFGFGAAVVAGFLLTAIPNWTGRLPLQGLPLAGLFAAWVAGRLAVTFSNILGAGLAAALDLSFLVLLLLVALREIAAGRNWRNLPMLLALAVLIAANGLTHLEALGRADTATMGARLSIATLVLLISLVGGRIIPSFTRNWLAKRSSTSLPVPFAGFDKVCLAATFLAFVGWVLAAEHLFTGLGLLAAGALQFARLSRWQGRQTLSEPLVWSLHLGYLWVPLGLLLLGFGIVAPSILAPTAGLHALTVGAIGGMTLAVMTRATLGHSGRELTADRWTAAIYTAIAAATVSRVAASVLPDLNLHLLCLSAIAWVVAFGLFAAIYGRIHLSR